MQPRPLIGITTSELRTAEGAHFARESEPPRRMLALGMAYLEAISAAGGIPLILAPLPARELEALIERLDGICLSGGPDLEPETYGSQPHPLLGPTEPEVDYFELGLARTAHRRGLPLLAICRGMQVLNVSRGGTLVQHLPDDVGEEVPHRQTEPASEPTHWVNFLPDSRLRALLDADELEVNSFHHQAIDRLGQGLRAVAWSGDGVIEAVETEGANFALGVQWHAECLTGRAGETALFEALVQAAGRDSAVPAS